MRALVIGASGGIGAALANGLVARGWVVDRLSRRSDPPLDLTDEASIAAAAAAFSVRAPYGVILVATGLLHRPGARRAPFPAAARPDQARDDCLPLRACRQHIR